MIFGILENVNQFKLRAAYGEAGNFAPNGALFTTYLNTSIIGNVGIITPATLGDPSIQPERQKEFRIRTGCWGIRQPYFIRVYLVQQES